MMQRKQPQQKQQQTRQRALQAVSRGRGGPSDAGYAARPATAVIDALHARQSARRAHRDRARMPKMGHQMAMGRVSQRLLRSLLRGLRVLHACTVA